jgi:rhodanese-related sulfurtransferase
MLEAIGFRHIRGYLTGGITGWRAAKLDVGMTTVLDIPALAERLERDEVVLLDVRDAGEWEAGHVEGSILFPYWRLRDEVPDEVRNAQKPLAVACASGVRSTLAASFLKRSGIKNVQHVADGGVPDLANQGIELANGS